MKKLITLSLISFGLGFGLAQQKESDDERVANKMESNSIQKQKSDKIKRADLQSNE